MQRKKSWQISQIIKNIYQKIEGKIGGEKAVIAFSGGIDSSVTAILVNKVLGDLLTAVYVDTGLMRHKETEFIKKHLKNTI